MRACESGSSAATFMKTPIRRIAPPGDELAALHSITLVGAGEQRRRHVETDSALAVFRLISVLVLGRRLHRKVRPASRP